MTITSEDMLEKLKAIGHICAVAREAMAAALQPGITTAELDAIGREVLERHGARSAPQLAYNFPGTTCISVNEEIAHGIPGGRVIASGDLVNIDVSAERDGVFADTGASYIVPEPADQRLVALCRDGKRAMWEGIRAVKAGAPLADIGTAIGAFARRHRYTLIDNLASHGVGDSLHDEPGEIPTWPDRSERRRIGEGLVFTIEPFLSLGGTSAAQRGDDPWTLIAAPKAPCVQYEHTVVATKRGAIVVTL